MNKVEMYSIVSYKVFDVGFKSIIEHYDIFFNNKVSNLYKYCVFNFLQFLFILLFK